MTSDSQSASSAAPFEVPRKLDRVLELDDYEEAVRQSLPRAVYGYVANGSESEATLHANRSVFDEWRLVTRVLVGVSDRTQRTTLFGQDYDAPFGIAPMGGSSLVAYNGATVMARAAGRSGVPFLLSANSIIPLEEITRVNPDAWFAAYQSPNRDAIEGMIKRVARAGFRVLVVTTDIPIGSNREKDARAGFSMPIRPNMRLGWDVASHPVWLGSVLGRTLARRGIPHLVNLEPDGGPGIFSRKVEGVVAHESLSWDHIRLMRDLWKGPFIAKGLLSVADVATARDCGLDGVILSNHGGRQLDQAVSPMQMLKAAVAEARGMTVMIDSGFRRGTDILKALALGARFVFVGRPFLFAAGLAGEAGVRHAIWLLARELDRDMAMLGLREVADIDQHILMDAHSHAA